jgi:hypothetical protein
VVAQQGDQRIKAANAILHSNWDMNWRKKDLRVGIIQDREITITTTTGDMLSLLTFQLFNGPFLIKYMW